jgi:hypothetical protein
MIKSRIGRACSKMRNAYRYFVRKSEGKRLLEDLGTDGRVTGYNKMELREIGWKNVG